MVEYVRKGGTLFVFPSRPAGNTIGQLWKDAPAESAEPSEFISRRWKFGEGCVIESSKDFYSWIRLSDSFEQNRSQESAAWAIQAVESILSAAKIQPGIRVMGNPPTASNLILSEIVSNEGTGPLGARTSGEGWISVTNLDTDATIDAPLTVLMPASSSIGSAVSTSTLEVTVPPEESLLLPLTIPICFDVPEKTPCNDAVMPSGAEYLGAVREGKALELNFYAPATAEIRLRLDHLPSHVTLQDSSIENQWDSGAQQLKMTIPRGASPDYARQLKVQMPYVPHAPSVAQAAASPLSDFELAVANAVRLPLGQSSYFAPFPPLVVFDDPKTTRVVFQATNPHLSKDADLDINVNGAYRGSGMIHMAPGLDAVTDMVLKPAAVAPTGKPYEADPNGLVHGTVELRGSHDREEMPISFLTLHEGVNAYRFDFDGDGSDEWILENAALRLIVSPKSGGRALALVVKENGADLFTSVGGVRDNFSFTPNPPGISPERARGRYGLFNRNYSAEWTPEAANPALRLRYHAPDVFPHGATIEKMLSLEGPETVHVNYAVTLDADERAEKANAGDGAAQNEPHPQAFVAVNSLPAVSDSARVTRICWNRTAFDAQTAKDSAAPERPASQSGPEAHCEDFVPGGPALNLPEEANQLEVRTRGRPGVAVEWDSGKMVVEPQRYSLLLELQSRELAPGEELKMSTIFRALPAE